MGFGPRLYHADDQAIGQVYVAAFDHYRDFRIDRADGGSV